MEVIFRNSSGKVILESVTEVEPVEAACDERIQISAPETFVVIPGLVFDLAAEIASYAAHLVSRLFFNGAGCVQRSMGSALNWTCSANLYTP